MTAAVFEHLPRRVEVPQPEVHVAGALRDRAQPAAGALHPGILQDSVQRVERRRIVALRGVDEAQAFLRARFAVGVEDRSTQFEAAAVGRDGRGEITLQVGDVADGQRRIGDADHVVQAFVNRERLAIAL